MKLRKFLLITTNLISITTFTAVSCTPGKDGQDISKYSIKSFRVLKTTENSAELAVKITGLTSTDKLDVKIDDKDYTFTVSNLTKLGEDEYKIVITGLTKNKEYEVDEIEVNDDVDFNIDQKFRTSNGEQAQNTAPAPKDPTKEPGNGNPKNGQNTNNYALKSFRVLKTTENSAELAVKITGLTSTDKLDVKIDDKDYTFTVSNLTKLGEDEYKIVITGLTKNKEYEVDEIEVNDNVDFNIDQKFRTSNGEQAQNPAPAPKDPTNSNANQEPPKEGNVPPNPGPNDPTPKDPTKEPANDKGTQEPPKTDPNPAPAPKDPATEEPGTGANQQDEEKTNNGTDNGSTGTVNPEKPALPEPTPPTNDGTNNQDSSPTKPDESETEKNNSSENSGTTSTEQDKQQETQKPDNVDSTSDTSNTDASNKSGQANSETDQTSSGNSQNGSTSDGESGKATEPGSTGPSTQDSASQSNSTISNGQTGSQGSNSETTSQSPTTQDGAQTNEQENTKKVTSTWSTDNDKTNASSEKNYYKFDEQKQDIYKETLLRSDIYTDLKLGDILPLRNFMAAILGISNINDLHGNNQEHKHLIKADLLKLNATGYNNEKENNELHVRKLENHFFGANGDTVNKITSLITKLETALKHDIKNKKNASETQIVSSASNGSTTTEGMQKIRDDINKKVQDFVNVYRKDDTLSDEDRKKYVDSYLNVYLNVARVRVIFSELKDHYTTNNSQNTQEPKWDDIFQKIFPYKKDSSSSSYEGKEFVDSFWTKGGTNTSGNTDTDPKAEANYIKVTDRQGILDNLYKHIEEQFNKITEPNLKDILPLRNTVASLLGIADVSNLKGKEINGSGAQDDKDWLVAKELLKDGVSDSTTDPSYTSMKHTSGDALHVRKIEKEIFGINGDGENNNKEQTIRNFIKELANKLPSVTQNSATTHSETAEAQTPSTEPEKTLHDIKEKAKKFVAAYAKETSSGDDNNPKFTKIMDTDIDKVVKLYFNTYLNKARVVKWTLDWIKQEANIKPTTNTDSSGSTTQ